MSVILFDGTIYRCTECGIQFQDNYQSGVTTLPITAPDVVPQQLVREELDLPKVCPGFNGKWPLAFGPFLGQPPLYVKVEIICEECIKKIVGDDSDVRQLRSLLEEVDEKLKLVTVRVRDRCDKPSRLDIEEAIGKSMCEELADRSMLPSRKRGRLNQTFQKWNCIDGFISRCINDTLAGMPKPLPDERLLEFVTNLNKQSLTEYQPREIGVARSSLPICSDGDVIEPPSVPACIRVYTKNTINLNQYRSKKYPYTQIHKSINNQMHDVVATFKKMTLAHFIGPTV